jgi:hypothetical protein
VPRLDSFGIVHVAADDEVTAEGMLHIHECGSCRATFPDAAAYVDAARASLANTETDNQ